MRMLQIAVLALTMAACGPQQAKTYPPQYELNFVRSCQAQAGASLQTCRCMWESVEARVPLDDFLAYERVPLDEQESHPVHAQLERFALACRDQAQPFAEPPPAP